MAALAGTPPEMQLDLQDELVDRYGPLPVETSTLFRIISLKKDLAACGSVNSNRAETAWCSPF